MRVRHFPVSDKELSQSVAAVTGIGEDHRALTEIDPLPHLVSRQAEDPSLPRVGDRVNDLGNEICAQASPHETPPEWLQVFFKPLVKTNRYHYVFGQMR